MGRKTFDQAHCLALEISSAVKYEEAKLLFEYACKAVANSTILEIGAHFGFSTVILAHVGLQVVTIDPLIPGQYKDPCHPGVCDIYEKDAMGLRKNLKPYSNVYWIRDKRELVNSAEIEAVGFVFIDAVHAYPNPLEDFLHFGENYLPGSYQAWHDYGTFDGVSRSVNELVAKGQIEKVTQCKSMVITRLKNG